MKFTLTEIEGLSGPKTRIYSPVIENDGQSLFEKFYWENIDMYRREITNLNTRLEAIGNDYGLFADFFKIGAGKFGLNVCTFKDIPGAKLRLYFIDYGLQSAIILGGGGNKPKDKRTSQEVPKLQVQIDLLNIISNTLQKAEKAGHFQVNEDGTIFSTTNYSYNSEDY